MALTPAEKMKRYRERIKNNPQKYEEFRKKDIERLQRRRKKISELNDTEKKVRRDQWAEQKRKQRTKKRKAEEVTEDNAKKNETIELKNNDNKVQTSQMRYLKSKCSKLSSESKRNEDRIKKLKTLCEKLKKRNYRLKIDAEKQIKNREKIIEKMKAREQVLEYTMKKTYQSCEKRCQKTILKRLITNAKVKSYVAKLLGITGKIKKTKPKKASFVPEEIVKFYVRDDVSRCTAGKKECRTHNKEKQQIRYLLNTLQNLYEKYKKEGGKYKFTTFYKYKPFYVLVPHLGSRNTCICVKHSNIDLKFTCLKKHSVVENINIKEILATQTCDLKSFECMHGKCAKCKNISIIYDANVQLNQNITWYQWETIAHKYSKKEGSETIEKTTKKTVKAEKNGTINQLLQEFKIDIKPFKKHYFNNVHQQEKYQYIINHLKKNEAVVICDFSENYETKLSEEIQSMHFGASKSQITLHTGMVYLQGMSQSFCTVSQNNMHQPPAIWAHLLPILKMIKNDFQVTTVHFYSDGPTSQYRQKNNFYLIDLFTQKLELNYVTWSFFESGHGKGVADGIGGSVKRVLDRQVCFGKDIRDACDAYEILKACMKTVKIWLIKDEEINNITSMLPNNITTLVGTMQIHQIITQGKGVLSYRDIACFCGEDKGLCNCFGLKTHSIREIIPDLTSDIPYNPEITSEILNFPMDEVDVSTSFMNEILNMPMDVSKLNMIDINLLPISILPDSEPNSPPPSCVEDENKYKITPKKAANVLTGNISCDPRPSFSKHDKLNCKKENKWVPKKSTKSNTITSAKPIKFQNCSSCTCSILGQKAKCLACKKIYCHDCVGGPINIDYLCVKCLTDSDED